MNRRTFLTTAGAASAAAALATPFHALGQQTPSIIGPKQPSPPPNPQPPPVSTLTIQLTNAANALGIQHAKIVAHHSLGIATRSDYATLASMLFSFNTLWKSGNMDAVLAPNFDKVNVDEINAIHLPTSYYAQTVTNCGGIITGPTAQAYMNNLLLNRYHDGVDYGVQTLNDLKSGGKGMSYHINAAAQAATLASEILAPIKTVNGKYVPQFSPPEGTGIQEACGWSYIGMFFSGFAFGTLAIMTWGTAPILIGELWGAFALVGGTGSLGWSILQDFFCGM